jgi:hypothetical protein
LSLRHLTAAAFLGLAACTLAACSGGGSPAPSAAGGNGSTPSRQASAGSAGGSTSPLCSYLTQSQIGAALKLPVGNVVTSVQGPVTVCAYTGRYEVIVRYQLGENTSQFAQGKQSMASLHQAVSDVSGLGDESFFAKYGSGVQLSDTLATRKGALAIFVTSPAPLDAERSLMSQLLTHV